LKRKKQGLHLQRMIQQPVRFQLQQQTLWLSPERSIFWEDEKRLIVSDIHFGKSGHFRKEGIGIPQTVFKEDLQRLISQIQFFQPKELIVVGDFFHSRMNNEIGLFEKWRKDLSYLPIHLVRGNHDILNNQWYTENEIVLQEAGMELHPFSFLHEPPVIKKEKAAVQPYLFTGHIHPGIRVEGTAKQSLRFPCFYFGEHYAVLPAFGRFTGLHAVKPGRKDKVFAIVNNSIIELQ
jgi:DNA ligase-associated metallophosphoesterase